VQAAPIATDVTAILGFSVEPLTQIQAQMASIPPSNLGTNASVNPAGFGGVVSKPGPDATLLAERIVKNLFHYVSGFAPGGGLVTADSLVSMSVIAKWYEKFLSKVKAGGVGFLEREE
jgi:protein Hikeshi